MVTIAQFDLFIGAYVTSTFVSSSEKTIFIKKCQSTSEVYSEPCQMLGALHSFFITKIL